MHSQSDKSNAFTFWIYQTSDKYAIIPKTQIKSQSYKFCFVSLRVSSTSLRASVLVELSINDLSLALQH